MSNNRVQKFDDETILHLFGAQAAEDETAERLKSYFVRNKSYERIKANIPLRLIVGHKGIGKSALLKIAYLEDMESGELSLWLQPNDIAASWSVDGSFVDRVEGIKKNSTEHNRRTIDPESQHSWKGASRKTSSPHYPPTYQLPTRENC